MTSMEEFLQLVSNVGFPIVVATYLLVRFEKKISDLSEKITELVDAIEKINK